MSSQFHREKYFKERGDISLFPWRSDEGSNIPSLVIPLK